MTREEKLDPELVRAAMIGERSMASVCRKLGLRIHSENYDAIRAVCEELDVAPPPRDRTVKEYVAPRPLASYLVENSLSTNSTVLKRRLVAEGYLERRCYGEGCAVTDTWLGAPITLQLEHRNGIHDDNRIENLCLLCPNCHSQTATYAGRGHKRRLPRLCRECEKPLSVGARSLCARCHRAASTGSTKISWPSLDDLAGMVERDGYSATGRALGVSDNAVRKRLSKGIA